MRRRDLAQAPLSVRMARSTLRVSGDEGASDGYYVTTTAPAAVRGGARRFGRTTL